jgi:predicted enzyme related to lactoylglutathione lyase
MATTKRKTKTETKAKPSMAAKASGKPARPARKRVSADVPRLFRINIEVGDLDRAAEFYAKLLDQPGRKQAGSRVYFTAGPVTLQVVDVSASGAPHPAAKALYFLVKDLDTAHQRAKLLGCLSQENVHGQLGGLITVRPWGERSFYADDPWRNPLCFVEEGTTYPG